MIDIARLTNGAYEACDSSIRAGYLEILVEHKASGYQYWVATQVLRDYPDEALDALDHLVLNRSQRGYVLRGDGHN